MSSTRDEIESIVIRHHSYLTNLMRDESVDFGARKKPINEALKDVQSRLSDISRSEYPSVMDNIKRGAERIAEFDKGFQQYKKESEGMEKTYHKQLTETPEAALQLEQEFKKDHASLKEKYPLIVDIDEHYDFVDFYMSYMNDFEDQLRRNEKTADLVRRRDALKTQLRELEKSELELASQYHPDLLFPNDPAELREAIQQLVASGKEAGNKKTELLLLTQKNLDMDLLEVIKMRANQCSRNQIQLIVMPYSIYTQMMETLIDHPLEGINKLSLLHHTSQLKGMTGVDYSNSIGAYAKRMPHLEAVLLRTCSSASEGDVPSKAYTMHIIKYHALESSPLGSHQLLFAQGKNESGAVTIIKYKNPHDSTKVIIHEIPGDNIPYISYHAMKLGEIKREMVEEVINKLKIALPTLPNLTFQNDTKADEAIVDSQALQIKFFDRTEAMPPEEIKRVRHVRNKKIKIAHFMVDSIAERVEKSLRAAQCENDITLTAYLGAYSAGPDRVVPWVSHNQEKLPKSLSVVISAAPKPLVERLLPKNPQ